MIVLRRFNLLLIEHTIPMNRSNDITERVEIAAISDKTKFKLNLIDDFN